MSESSNTPRLKQNYKDVINSIKATSKQASGLKRKSIDRNFNKSIEPYALKP